MSRELSLVETLLMSGDLLLLGCLSSQKCKHNENCPVKGADIYWSSPHFWVPCVNCDHELIHEESPSFRELELLRKLSNSCSCQKKKIPQKFLINHGTIKWNS